LSFNFGIFGHYGDFGNPYPFPGFFVFLRGFKASGKPAAMKNADLLLSAMNK